MSSKKEEGSKEIIASGSQINKVDSTAIKNFLTSFGCNEIKNIKTSKNVCFIHFIKFDSHKAAIQAQQMLGNKTYNIQGKSIKFKLQADR